MPHRRHREGKTMKTIATFATLPVSLALLFALSAPAARAQGSRKDDIVFGPTGHPIAGATIRVCAATATGTPCTPLATIYTDATLATTTANPFQGDGIGNYHFYAPAGRYLVQVSAPQITGVINYPDTILPPDVSSTGAGNNISAFGLSLGGNLTVAGNATINGTLTSASFSPGAFSPSSLNVTGSASIQGPRPYIDVTAYGAKGDGATDDTTAITNAINTACATAFGSGYTARPDVVFPPGYYALSQPQSPSTSPVLPSCSALRLVGMGTGVLGSPLTRGPKAVLQVIHLGSSPSAAPVFAFTNFPNVTISGLEIQGYNQAVSAYASGGLIFDNACLGVNSTATGLTDNTPLKITNTIEVLFKEGCLFGPTGNSTLPTALFTGETPIASEAPQTAYVRMENVLTTGGGFQYIQRVAGANIPGFFTFVNVLQEAVSTDFFAISNSTGTPGNLSNFGPVTVEDSEQADLPSAGTALVSFTGGLGLEGVYINHSQIGNQPSYAIRMGSGTFLQYYDVVGCGSQCATTVMNSSGLPAGQGFTQNANGLDFLSDTTSTDRLRTDLWNPNGNYNGLPLRFTKSGSALASLGIDPQLGFLFANPATLGYNSGFLEATAPDVDVEFSTTNPPTNLAGTPATGGSLAAGTYYFALFPTTGSCASPATVGAPAVLNTGVAVSGSNHEVSLTWTASAAGTTPIVGYCLIPSTSAVNEGSSGWISISGASTTNFTYTGQATAAGALPFYNAMQSAHRFTPSSLGVNTTSPQYNLDVNGSAAVNSLNGVQKAERFSGSDAAAKINACLTAASTTSSVCDARGLTGSLTGSSHIQIPAGAVLLWGQAQLAINDTTNNDAIELMGDGSSLIGYQESGSGTVPRPDSSGYISCVPSGCTALKNPNAATRNVDWVHISGINLQATGAGSKVIDLTSVGHADLEGNRLIMGTGGGSYGIFGDTSTGGFDSTNTLIKHNEIDPQFQNDRCLHLAGVFNVVEMEQNTCILPAANIGTVCFEIAKDSSGNYPNNDEFYGNDCEGASTSFGQIGYNIINADSVTIGPNNRCENVYSCFQFPTDGSAVGIHILDPYISVSANSVIKPNEPSTAQIAIDNNGPNWLPSMHYGFNDLAGRNLLGNAAFEGWSNSTTLYYWGGVSGSNINQAGSGIYAQNTSAGTPADSSTQGTYNVKIGDNATAGLGINSGCVQIDATMNYTLAFRIAASSTGINFRPGFRFYSDPNCTEADKITSVATNARVLTPANYVGQSALVGTGSNPNWQSTNASLTYNNGITCNCNVTGSDWQVSTASSWTATRNFAITFRVPNAYSSTSTVAQSMRVFILENTAANPNQIFVDDAVLSEGPVTPVVPATAGVSDSVNPTVYGNLTVDGSLAVGSSALPAALTSGTPTANDCAAFTSGTVTNIQDAGSPCPTQFTRFSMGFLSGGEAPSATNAVDVSVVYLPNIQFSHLTVDVSTTDSSTSDFYSWALTDTSGNVKCSITAVNLTAGGADDQSCTQGTVTLASGAYVFAFTGNATTAKIAYSGTAPLALSSAVSSSSSSSGAMTFPISIPAAGVTFSGYGLPAIILH
jgi:hypothetical protein